MVTNQDKINAKTRRTLKAHKQSNEEFIAVAMEQCISLQCTLKVLSERFNKYSELGGNPLELFKLSYLCKELDNLSKVISFKDASDSEPDLLKLPPATTVESSISTINKDEEIQVETVIEEAVVEIQAEVQTVQEVKNDASSTVSINKCEESTVTNNTPITTKGTTKMKSFEEQGLRGTNNSTVNTATVNTTSAKTMQESIPATPVTSEKVKPLFTSDSQVAKVELIVNITLGENKHLSEGTKATSASKGVISSTRSSGRILGNSKDDTAWAEFHIFSEVFKNTDGVDNYGIYNNAIWRFTDSNGAQRLLTHQESKAYWATIFDVQVEDVDACSEGTYVKVQMPASARAISEMLYGGHTSLRSYIITFNDAVTTGEMFNHKYNAYKAENNKKDFTCLSPLNATVSFSSSNYNLASINTLGASPNSNLRSILCTSVKEKKSFLEVINSKSAVRRDARKEANAQAKEEVASTFDFSPSTPAVVIPEVTVEAPIQVQAAKVSLVEAAEENTLTPTTMSADAFRAKRAKEVEVEVEVEVAPDYTTKVDLNDPQVIAARKARKEAKAAAKAKSASTPSFNFNNSTSSNSVDLMDQVDAMFDGYDNYDYDTDSDVSYS